MFLAIKTSATSVLDIKLYTKGYMGIENEWEEILRADAKALGNWRI